MVIKDMINLWNICNGVSWFWCCLNVLNLLEKSNNNKEDVYDKVVDL